MLPEDARVIVGLQECDHPDAQILMATWPSFASVTASSSVAKISIWHCSIEMTRLSQGLTISRHTLGFLSVSLIVSPAK